MSTFVFSSQHKDAEYRSLVLRMKNFDDASMGAAGAGALCGRARRGLEAAPGRGGRPRGRWSFRRLGFGARGCAGAARRPASFFLCVPYCWDPSHHVMSDSS
jgi:hypothetical protein